MGGSVTDSDPDAYRACRVPPLSCVPYVGLVPELHIGDLFPLPLGEGEGLSVVGLDFRLRLRVRLRVRARVRARQLSTADRARFSLALDRRSFGNVESSGQTSRPAGVNHRQR